MYKAAQNTSALLLLIALAFNHSIPDVLHCRESIIQPRTVILIALLALARRFVILDASKMKPFTSLGLAVAVFVLGAVYRLVRDRDRKDTQAAPRTASAVIERVASPDRGPAPAFVALVVRVEGGFVAVAIADWTRSEPAWSVEPVALHHDLAGLWVPSRCWIGCQACRRGKADRSYASHAFRGHLWNSHEEPVECLRERLSCAV